MPFAFVSVAPASMAAAAPALSVSVEGNGVVNDSAGPAPFTVTVADPLGGPATATGNLVVSFSVQRQSGEEVPVGKYEVLYQASPDAWTAITPTATFQSPVTEFTFQVPGELSLTPGTAQSVPLALASFGANAATWPVSFRFNSTGGGSQSVADFQLHGLAVSTVSSLPVVPGAAPAQAAVTVVNSSTVPIPAIRIDLTADGTPGHTNPSDGLPGLSPGDLSVAYQPPGQTSLTAVAWQQNVPDTLTGEVPPVSGLAIPVGTSVWYLRVSAPRGGPTGAVALTVSFDSIGSSGEVDWPTAATGPAVLVETPALSISTGSSTAVANGPPTPSTFVIAGVDGFAQQPGLVVSVSSPDPTYSPANVALSPVGSNPAPGRPVQARPGGPITFTIHYPFPSIAPSTLAYQLSITGDVKPTVLRVTAAFVDLGSVPPRTITTARPVQYAVDAAPFGPVDAYTIVAKDGSLYSYGDGTDVQPPLPPSNPPFVGAASTPTLGHWRVAADGGVFSSGGARFYGSMGGRHLNAPIVAMAATSDGRGYWLVACDGGIFTFGDARYYGSMGGRHLNAPTVAMAATPDGRGYWLVASDGGTFTFGDATFHGSMGSHHLNRPVLAMSPSADGNGYWLAASDGGIFTFGDARFYGSAGGRQIQAPVAGMAAGEDGDGYALLDQNGTVYSFGDFPNFGSFNGPASGSFPSYNPAVAITR